MFSSYWMSSSPLETTYVQMIWGISSVWCFKREHISTFSLLVDNARLYIFDFSPDSCVGVQSAGEAVAVDVVLFGEASVAAVAWLFVGEAYLV